MTTTIRFDLDFFASLISYEGHTKWQLIQLLDLADDEAFLISQFLEAATGSTNFPPETEVLLAKFTPDGVVERVYGPCLFAAPEGTASTAIIMKLGALEIPVTAADGEVIVGRLSGRFVTRHMDGSHAMDGSESDFVELALYSEELETKYTINAKFRDAAPSDAKLNALAKKNDLAAIAAYLGFPPGASATAINLKDLGIGEYLLKDIRTVDTRYGPRYILGLANGTEAWAVGNAERLLRVQAQRDKIQAGLAAGETWTLKIAGIEWIDDVRARVTCGIYNRTPRNSANNSAKLPAASSKVLADAKTFEDAEIVF